MKHHFLLITIIILIYKLVFASCPSSEISIDNETAYDLYIKIYPVSMVFNWAYDSQTGQRKPGYNIIAKTKVNQQDFRFDYISGAIYDKINLKVIATHKVPSLSSLCGQFDGESGGVANFCYGSGKYRLDF